MADISLLPGPQMSVQVGIHADWCLRGGGGFGFAEPLSMWVGIHADWCLRGGGGFGFAEPLSG
ncbi:MAG: hypothetical protein KBG29_04975 [Pseudomonadales bacterium]|nr:hypothetical protein [Pseudomonadales bacterium]